MTAEIIGYSASLLLALSLIVNNDIKFRWINSGGCALFIIYGLVLNAFPIILSNTLLLCINSIYLIRIYRKDDDFEIIEITEENGIVQSFIRYYKADIEKYFFDFTTINSNRNTISFVVIRNMMIANLFVAELDDDGLAQIKINYTIPKYRDFKVGRYLFQTRKEFLVSKGMKKIVYTEVQNKNHERFLRIMGFRPSAKPGISYSLSL